MNPLNIAQGFWNQIFKTDGVEKLAEERLKICEKCPARVYSKSLGFRCSGKKKIRNVETGQLVRGCGCILAAKSRATGDECPAAKWKAVWHE